MRKLIPVIIVLLAPDSPSFAELCSIDVVPAATLLVPYFEVDLDDTDGVTTLFSINNADAAPALAHVVFWTDWSYPTLSFDVYLTGYDVLSVNLRDVFDGNVPITADAPNDPGQTDPATFCGTKSPCGGDLFFSSNRHWDDNDPDIAGEQGFTNCEQIFPGFLNPTIVGAAMDRLVSGHTGGVVSSLDACVGHDHGDNVARGYITIDSVSECSLATDPAGVGLTGGLTGTPYFADGGSGVANNANRLWGDWFLVDVANNFAQGDMLVHIEADSSLSASQTPEVDPDTGVPLTGYTFYSRYFPAPSDGRDNREPLGTIWGSRYLNGGVFDRTELVVWRDSTAAELTPIPRGEAGDWCGSGPSWFPLNETEVLAFNESEDAVEICAFTTGGAIWIEDDPYCFAWETGRYEVSEAPLDVPYNFGWLYLNLNLKEDGPIGDHDFGTDGNVAQSHVTTLHRAKGLFSVGLQAVELSHACLDFNEILNGSEVNGGTNEIPFF